MGKLAGQGSLYILPFSVELVCIEDYTYLLLHVLIVFMWCLFTGST